MRPSWKGFTFPSSGVWKKDAPQISNFFHFDAQQFSAYLNRHPQQIAGDEMQNDTINKLYTPAEAAPRLSVSPATLNSWRCRGKGPHYVKLGGKIFYRQADIDDFIAKSVIDPTYTAA
jgi:hypothetical protein